jgi:uncharacterized protein (TIGR03435 family)
MFTRSVLRRIDAKEIVLAAAGAALTLSIAVATIYAPAMRAQSAPAATPKFAVASIRPCGDPGLHGRGGGASPARLELECQTAAELIREAYVVFADGRQANPSGFAVPISGGPAWINSDGYRISATVEGNPSRVIMRGQMLQALLEDRFKLRLHRETREFPVYALTVAKGGPKLQPLKQGSCLPRDYTKPGVEGFRDETGQRLCTILVGLTGVSGQMSLDDLSKTLSAGLDRPVINRTGIIGTFDLRLEFVRDQTTAGLLPGIATDPADGTSIFTAIQEQLGLKLESTKGPGELLVIDGVERPSEN